MSNTKKYFVWIGGESPSNRTYLADLQSMELTEELLEMDNDELYERFSDWTPDRERLEEGFVAWGPYTDQWLGIAESEDADEPLFLFEIDEMIMEERVAEVTHHLPYDIKGKFICAAHTEVGGYSGTLELPAEQALDPSLFKVNIVTLADTWTVLNGVTYADEYIDLNGDTSGKSSEYYIYQDDQLELLS